MNKNIFIMALCAAGTWTSVAQTTDGFHLQIQLETPKDGQILVAERVPNATDWFVDTLQLKDGCAVYTGKVKYPRMTTFVLHDDSEDFMGSFSMFLDNSPTIVARGRSIKDVVVTGSPATDEWRRIEEGGRALFRRYGDLSYQRSKAYTDSLKHDSLVTLAGEAYDEMFRYVLSIPGYATSQVTPYYIYDRFMGNTDKLEKALGLFSPVLDGNAYVEACRAELTRQKNAAVGQPAYDFSLQDVKGNTYRLSDYRGRYVLVEFSASWCGWCKKEIPYLQRVYEQHKDCKNFAMLTINLDDKREKWVKDVEHYNLPWPVVSDLKGFNGDVTEAYNVHGIPAIFLIDPQGRIVDKDLRGEEMIQTVNRRLQEMHDVSFRIDGRIEGLDGGTARLYAMPPSNQLLDSCVVENGKYMLGGTLPKACKAMLFVDTSNHDFGMMQSIYLQPGTISVDSKRTDGRYVTSFAGASVQEELDKLIMELKQTAAYKEFSRLSDEIQKEYMTKGSASASLKLAQQDAVMKAFSVLLEKPGRTGSAALVCLVADYSGVLTPDQIESLCRRFDASLHDDYYMTEMRDYVANERKLAAGKPAPDFVAQDLQGQSHRLSDYRGKYVFLEFSASWCGWCKKEVPFIRRAYEKLNGKGIVFLTLMMDDRKDLWQGEVDKLGITWQTLSDLKGIRASEIAKAYNVSGIPASFVISPDGKIIHRDLRGEQVFDTLSRYAAE